MSISCKTFYDLLFKLLFNSIIPSYYSKSGNMSDPTEVMPPLTEMLWAFGVIALYCEFSERVITAFDEFSDELDRCNWYLLPNRLQQTYLTFLLDTQQPKMIQGYGNISCTRATFKMVGWWILPRNISMRNILGNHFPNH